MMERVSLGKRLVYLIEDRVNEDFWNEHWSEEEVAQILSLWPKDGYWGISKYFYSISR